MSAGFGIGKEVLHAIIGGLIAISICVAIGSTIAQAMSHGPGHGAEAAPAEAAPAEAAPAEAAPAEAAPAK